MLRRLGGRGRMRGLSKTCRRRQTVNGTRGSIIAIALLVALGPIFGLPGSTWAEEKADKQEGTIKDKPDKHDDQIIVKFRAGVPEAVEDDVHKKKGGAVKNEVRGLDVKVVKVAKGKAAEAIEAYQEDPNVEYVEPLGIGYVDWIPSDGSYAQQWGLDNTGQNGGKVDADVDGPRAWDLTRGASAAGVRSAIAILDTGIREDHPDLAGKVVDRRNWTFAPTIDDVVGHGTHVAGIAAASTNNATGIAGVCPDCVIVNGKVCDDSGACNYDYIANGVLWAVGCEWRDQAGNCLSPVRARSINISITGTYNSITLRDAINKAWSRGAVVSCAAGNDGRSTMVYPAGYNNCIAVAATDRMDARASFSNFGSSWVDLAAPGASILSTVTSGGYESWSGTSMAAPHVAGAAGLVWSTKLCSANNCVRTRVESNADRIGGTGSQWAKGRLNACRAVGGTQC